MNRIFNADTEKFCEYTVKRVLLILTILLSTVTFADSGVVCANNTLPSEVLETGVIASNSHRLSSSTLLFKTEFDKNGWHGELSATALSKQSTAWHASDIDPSQRQLFTINQNLETDRKGITLEWNALSKNQIKSLQGMHSLPLAKQRLAWLKGNDSELLRVRKHLLGDIIHSNISFLGQLQNFGHASLKGSEGGRYREFLNNKFTRKEVVFVGANDGILHAFDADNGDELFGYIPNEVFSKVAKISHPNYGCDGVHCLEHEYLVDGKTSIGDAYYNDSWHSILIGTLGLGGRGIYALDVSEPTKFKKEDVLWEVSPTEAPINIEIYANHMGLISQEANIVRLKNGKWVAIIGNGYQSQSAQAVLFIIDIETGSLIRAINTNAGSASQPNGLSAPVSIDSDGDHFVDTIYAGDLLGNLWRFDVSSADESNWKLSFNNKPLFRACEDSACNKPQMITAKPQVGNHPEGGLMVYMGTGNSAVQDKAVLNSFYALRDNNRLPITSIKHLVMQEILQENSVGSSLDMRITSNKSVDYEKFQGWYLNLTKPFSQPKGEQITTQPLLKEGQLIITSEIPLEDACSAYTHRWLMKLDALQGKRLSTISFDTNNDKEITARDNTDYKGKSVIVSGVLLASKGLSSGKPVILGQGQQFTNIYSMGEGASIEKLKANMGQPSGRVSWRQLH